MKLVHEVKMEVDSRDEDPGPCLLAIVACSHRRRGQDKTHRNWVETRQNCLVGGVHEQVSIPVFATKRRYDSQTVTSFATILSTASVVDAML